MLQLLTVQIAMYCFANQYAEVFASSRRWLLLSFCVFIKKYAA